MQQPDFWNNVNLAGEVTQEFKRLNNKLNCFNDFKFRIEDIEVLSEIVSEDEESSINDIVKEISSLKEDMESFMIQILLCGQYDKNNAILSLHTGVGGTDAQDWTEMLLRMYTRWCESKGFKLETLDYLPGDEAGVKSVTLKVSGDFAYGYLKAEKGIHRLVRISPFNANGKRQTSFASMEVLPELTEDQDIDINPVDLRIDTFRAGGAGGQHVNKTESAIRITHIPTGIVVSCQNQRSQHSNKETAMKMLKSKLIELKERAHKEKVEDLTGELKDMGWGSQIRSYVFHPYSMVKDHRTGTETSNVTAIMDGEIDIFINSYLSSENN
ncbi:bacterial peptide chain release factor 2 (bRF-2) [Clostridium frigidicarnis]|uniref:Peptide chain release factor 2 n=2 Tax=Clostridium frigidicarnis TaxID=84698 RepID=A0A1I0Y295_9CLOT|nr:bacterial peptide chain release factor 2 (bRF-2) [Clostridium frigidicarnis]